MVFSVQASHWYQYFEKRFEQREQETTARLEQEHKVAQIADEKTIEAEVERRVQLALQAKSDDDRRLSQPIIDQLHIDLKQSARDLERQKALTLSESKKVEEERQRAEEAEKKANAAQDWARHLNKKLTIAWKADKESFESGQSASQSTLSLFFSLTDRPS